MLTYERIKRFYDRNLWELWQVKEAVRLNVITEEQYKEMTGFDYVPD